MKANSLTLQILGICFIFTNARIIDPIIQQFNYNSIYQQGTHVVQQSSISEGSAPTPILVFAPKEDGFYPVIYFQHGFLLRNSIYSQMLSHICSHGFIIIAPQMDSSLLNSDATGNIQDAERVIQWLPSNLKMYLPTGVSPEMNKFVVMGHSKGGKIAFALALKIKSNVSLPFSALIGVDPVDGDGQTQTVPPVLTFKNSSFNLPYPTLVIGTGYGPESVFPGFPACAPAKHGHMNFYLDSSVPAFDFLPLNYGHMDVLNDNDNLSLTERIIAGACKGSSSGRAPMRKFTSGIVVAFLRAVLYGESSIFRYVVDNSSEAPVKIAMPLSNGSV